MATPLADAEFDDLMGALGPFEKKPALVIAVSGGADSLALTLLAQRWAASRGGRAIGLTVDHGLRPGSSEEARQTGRWLSAYNIEHHILTWTGPKPTTGLQREAREARYHRLTTWCRDAGILHLLTGHHRQDQAETVALRKARKSGPDGLAGMAAIRDLQGMRLLRPLLGIDKARLIATLDRRQQAWIDDPSNRNPSFSRNRLRRDGIDHEQLLTEAACHGHDRYVSEKQRHAAHARTACLDPAGFAWVAESLIGDLEDQLAAPLAARLLMTVSGGVYPPRSHGLKQLLHAMRHDRPFAGKTLGHCRILSRKGRWLFCCENTLSSTLTLIPGIWQNWENRFLARSRHQDQENQGLSLRQLGDDGWPKRHDLVVQGRSREIPQAARTSLPSIWRGETLLAIPHIGRYERSFDPSLLDLHFRPATPLANAPFAAHMCAYSTDQTVALAH